MSEQTPSPPQTQQAACSKCGKPILILPFRTLGVCGLLCLKEKEGAATMREVLPLLAEATRFTNPSDR